jgi:chromosome segregation ATPase
MDQLELKRLRVQLKNVDAAREEIDLRISERQEEIKRLQETLKIQDAKMAELKAKISDAESKNMPDKA